MDDEKNTVPERKSPESNGATKTTFVKTADSTSSRELIDRAAQSKTTPLVIEEDELLFADEEPFIGSENGSQAKHQLTTDSQFDSSRHGYSIQKSPSSSNRHLAPDSMTLSEDSNEWKILVVDDDHDVLHVTRLGLRNLEVMNKPARIITATSATEARSIFELEADIAVLITDVVMESHDAGLSLIEWLRSDPRGQQTRIVVRTGQPGFAPEEFVLKTFDINDYWPKTSTDIGRMRSQLMGLIRSYADIQNLFWQSRQLQTLANSMNSLIGLQALTDVFNHLEREMEQLDVCWICFEAVQTHDETPNLTVVQQSSRNGSELIEAAIVDVHAVLTSDNSITCDSDRFQISKTVLEGGHCLAFAFCLKGQGRRLRRFLELRGTIYGQAIQNARLNQRTHDILTASKRFVPQDLIRLLGHADLTSVASGNHVTIDAWVMFLDIRGFTARAEQLALEKTHLLLEGLFAALIPKIESAGGILDKLLGDGLMALFPIEQAPIVCAVELVNLVEQIEPSVQLSIGIHGGAVNLCALGYRERLEITAIADAVNIAARLEQSNRRYHSTIIASDAALRSVVDPIDIRSRPLGRLRLKGRAGLVEAVEIVPSRMHHTKANGQELQFLTSTSSLDSQKQSLSNLISLYPLDKTLSVLLNDLDT